MIKNNKDESKNIYSLPFDSTLELKPEPAPAHYKSMKNCLDFAMPEGTPVLAAFDGEVIEVVCKFVNGGGDEFLRPKANLIRLKHENDEYSEYVHLKYKGANVEVGQKVKQGDLIGYSGSTGFSTYPHLHFGVYRLNLEEKVEYVLVRIDVDGKIDVFKSPDYNR